MPDTLYNCKLKSEGYRIALDDPGWQMVVATALDNIWAKKMVIACNSHNKLIEAVAIGVAHIELFPQDAIGKVVIKVMEQALKEAQRLASTMNPPEILGAKKE